MPRAEFTAAQWEAQRATFTRLYRDEERLLKDIVNIMAVEHHFVATERQYKRKIVTWNLDKNIKEKDMEIIVHKMRKRKIDESKDSEFVVHGRVVHPNKISRYCKVNPPVDTSFSNNIATPPYMQYSTPPLVSQLHCCQNQSASADLEPQGFVFPSYFDINDQYHAIHPNSDDRNVFLVWNRQGQIQGVELPLSSSGSILEIFGEVIAKVSSFLWHGPFVKPHQSYCKWTTAILATTQVTHNLCLLALLYIYRLRRLNPYIIPTVGSEFRVMATALMLANKYLDDNNYTNRTWAEVSGIPVTEIHIMEIEFASNARYSLHIGNSQFAEWGSKFARIKNANVKNLC